MAQKNVRSGKVESESAQIARLRAEMDALREENEELERRAKQANGALQFKVCKAGTAIGKTGRKWNVDVLQVSGGAVGKPRTHTPEKWVELATEAMPLIVEYIEENKLT